VLSAAPQRTSPHTQSRTWPAKKRKLATERGMSTLVAIRNDLPESDDESQRWSHEAPTAFNPLPSFLTLAFHARQLGPKRLNGVRDGIQQARAVRS